MGFDPQQYVKINWGLKRGAYILCDEGQAYNTAVFHWDTHGQTVGYGIQSIGFWLLEGNFT